MIDLSFFTKHSHHSNSMPIDLYGKLIGITRKIDGMETYLRQKVLVSKLPAEVQVSWVSFFSHLNACQH